MNPRSHGLNIDFKAAFANGDTDNIFSNLVMKGNGGSHIISMAAPALSTQFVKSEHTTKAQPGQDGAFAKIHYPSWQTVSDKQRAKHGEDRLLGYRTTRASDFMPGGFGERSARALQREEGTYQLKGTFPQAVLAFSKLRARVEAREGDINACDMVFSMLWGLKVDQVKSLPKLHLAGSEATRMSAMEDRAYHALSGHPGHNGGYRVDTATLAPDALGEDTPLNWPRLRTALKSIALIQLQGDQLVADMLGRIQLVKDATFCMDIVLLSQARYMRGYPIERIVEGIMVQKPIGDLTLAKYSGVPGASVTQTYMDTFFDRLTSHEDYIVQSEVVSIANLVSEASNKALQRTTEIILEHDRERAVLDEMLEDEFDEIDDSMLAMTFEVPRYKLTTKALNRGFRKENLGKDESPDMVSHGKSRLILDLEEFRAAQLMMPIDIAGALNLAVFLVVLHPSTRTAAYMLMAHTPGRPAGESMVRSVAEYLRRPSAFAAPEIRQLGDVLFADVFTNTFDMLLRNMSSVEYRNDLYVKQTMWDYLSARCPRKRKCPFAGGWRDLIMELRTCEEGWSLYYWVRISIGKRHHAMSASILAPIAAGQHVDFLTMVKRAAKERATNWATSYAARYKKIEGEIRKDKEMQRVEKGKPAEKEHGKYVPPHLRTAAMLDGIYDEDTILNRRKKFKLEEYKQMVELQSKSKFFAQMQIYTCERQFTVGVSDENLRLMFIEFYQARWFSLDKRIKRAKKMGKVFKLGLYSFPEHPWGEFCEQMPATVQGVLAYMSQLDPRAWTIPPTYLMEKLEKSIQELWEDISREITAISEYIREVAEDLADEQEQVDECRDVTSVISAMAGVDAITLPTFGYRPPYRMTQRQITVAGVKHPFKIDTQQTSFTDPKAVPVNKTPDIDMELGGEEDDDEEHAQSSLKSIARSHQSEVLEVKVKKADFLSLRNIWHLLGLPDREDKHIRHCMGVPFDYDLDDGHVSEEYGPVFVKGEDARVVRAWRHKMAGINHRLGLADGGGQVDDM